MARTSAVIFGLLALAIVAHHRWAHAADPRLTAAQKWFQVSDLANHETWAVAAAAAGLCAAVA
jgi:hypothetical protein